MAELNVTELLHDPDFVDEMTLITRTPAINSRGENILTESCLTTVGSIQPASGRTISRLPEALRVGNVNSFWFQGIIQASAPGKYSSIIVFKNLRYQVQMVFDWTQYGPGYTEGVCIAEVPT